MELEAAAAVSIDNGSMKDAVRARITAVVSFVMCVVAQDLAGVEWFKP